MTRRLVAAIANPHLDVLGHMTGRMTTGKRRRPPSEFDAEIVFAAAKRFDKAVEVNSRPERLDPPKRLLRLAVEAGCRVAIDSDAHAPGQLAWLPNGCERAFLCGVEVASVINAQAADACCAGPAATTRRPDQPSGQPATIGPYWPNRRLHESGGLHVRCPCHRAVMHLGSIIRRRHSPGDGPGDEDVARVRGAWVKEQRVNIGRDGSIEYQANILVTFILEGLTCP